MKYPKFMTKLNERFAHVAGLLVLFIGVLSVIEVISRSVFNAPTTWTADLEKYMLIFAIFLASGYAFQVKAHIKVDILTNRFNTTGQRVFAFITYGIVLWFLVMFTRSTINILVSSYQSGAMTYAFFMVPKWILMTGVLIGCVLMIATVILIVLDLCAKSDEYLK